MPYEHEYRIDGLPRRDMGEDKEVITAVHVRLRTTDGVHEDDREFVHPFPDPKAPFTPFADLDAATVLGWIPAAVKADWQSKMEARVADLAAAAKVNARSDVPADFA